MVTIELNKHSAEDVKDIQFLQSLGVPDEVIQEYYNKEQERRCGSRMGGDGNA